MIRTQEAHATPTGSTSLLPSRLFRIYITIQRQRGVLSVASRSLLDLAMRASSSSMASWGLIVMCTTCGASPVEKRESMTESWSAAYDLRYQYATNFGFGVVPERHGYPAICYHGAAPFKMDLSSSKRPMWIRRMELGLVGRGSQSIMGQLVERPVKFERSLVPCLQSFHISSFNV